MITTYKIHIKNHTEASEGKEDTPLLSHCCLLEITVFVGAWVAQLVKRLPSAQVTIPGAPLLLFL